MSEPRERERVSGPRVSEARVSEARVSGPRRYLIVCAAVSAGVLAYALAGALHLPIVWYHPLARTWSWARGAGPAMGWYGRTLAAGVVAAAAGAIAWAAVRRARPGRRAIVAATVALIAAQVIAIAAVIAAA